MSFSVLEPVPCERARIASILTLRLQNRIAVNFSIIDFAYVGTPLIQSPAGITTTENNSKNYNAIYGILSKRRDLMRLRN